LVSDWVICVHCFRCKITKILNFRAQSLALFGISFFRLRVLMA
jgi:hypothetical protein